MTGALKSYIPSLRSLVAQKLSSYFGPPPAAPQLRVFAPNHPALTPSPRPSPRISPNETGGHILSGNLRPTSDAQRAAVNLLLLSSTDGRDTLVDLTRTLTEMAQARKLRPSDITSELINTEICATTSISDLKGSSPTPNGSGTHDSPTPSSLSDSGEPDLLIIFGPYVKLDGYPPWQVRLTEIFCVGDSGGDVSGRVGARVEYQAFLRGLWRYAGADMKFGR
jgi:dehydrodolichyl diphosphate syntase complex subunit NUS1